MIVDAAPCVQDYILIMSSHIFVLYVTVKELINRFLETFTCCFCLLNIQDFWDVKSLPQKRICENIQRCMNMMLKFVVKMQ